MENGKQLNFENSDEYIDVITKVENQYEIHISENDLEFVKLTWKDGIERMWPELRSMGIYTFNQFRTMANHGLFDENIKVQIKKSDIGKNDEK